MSARVSERSGTFKWSIVSSFSCSMSRAFSEKIASNSADVSAKPAAANTSCQVEGSAGVDDDDSKDDELDVDEVLAVVFGDRGGY